MANVNVYKRRISHIWAVSLKSSYLCRTACSSHYGTELWDLSNKSIKDVCVTWRKGLRRVWGIPMDTHSGLLAPMCNSIPIIDELCRRNCNFINSYLISDSFLVRSVAVRGIYFGRMSSPLGRNARFCCESINFSLCNFSQLSSNLDYVKFWQVSLIIGKA